MSTGMLQNAARGPSTEVSTTDVVESSGVAFATIVRWSFSPLTPDMRSSERLSTFERSGRTGPRHRRLSRIDCRRSGSRSRVLASARPTRSLVTIASWSSDFESSGSTLATWRIPTVSPWAIIGMHA